MAASKAKLLMGAACMGMGTMPVSRVFLVVIVSLVAYLSVSQIDSPMNHNSEA